ncbi:hypothetical protein MHOL44478_14175 [Mycobacterium holsaticum DSM 44478]|nr:hypothetical protein [Mycolicibacterium holsaticum DSM 44478 = JCM 12374]
MAVGAGGAFTVGENGLGPGSMRGAFSVGGPGSTGVAGGAVVVVVVVVVVVSSGVDSSPAHDAVVSTIAAIAAPPATAATRRRKRPGLIVFSPICPDLRQRCTKITTGQ